MPLVNAVVIILSTCCRNDHRILNICLIYNDAHIGIKVKIGSDTKMSLCWYSYNKEPMA